MKQLKTFAQVEINTLKLAPLAETYNAFAVELGVKTIKKFRDRDTGICRVTELQEQYVEEFTEYVKKSQKSNSFKPSDTQRVISCPTGTPKKARGKYTDETFVQYGEHTAKRGTAMGLIQECITSLGGFDGNDNEVDVKAGDVIFEFKSRFEQIRGNSEITTSFARGYLTGAIRQGYVQLDEE